MVLYHLSLLLHTRFAKIMKGQVFFMPRKKQVKRSDGTYEYKITVGKDLHGKAIRKSFYSAKSLAEAKAKAQEYIISSRVSALTGQPVSGPGRHEDTFSHWAMQWLETYKKPTVTQNTYHLSYFVPVTCYLIPFFGDADLCAIQPVDVQRFFNERRDLSMSYLKKFKLCLTAIFECAYENGVPCRNPVKHVKLVSAAQPHEKRVYTDAQIETVKYCARMEFPAVYILLELGLRRGELCGLMWSDIDRNARTIRIDRSVRTTAGTVSIAEPKHGSRRVLPLSDECLEVFDSIPRRSMYIFPNAAGKPWDPNGFSRSYNRFMDTLPSSLPRLTPHELRHTCGTALRRRGVDIYTIQKYLGHQDIDVTANTYVHSEIETMRAALDTTTKPRQTPPKTAEN